MSRCCPGGGCRESRVPYKGSQQIEGCVRAALAKVSELNDMDGVFSPPDSAARGEQEAQAAAGDGTLRSILFPLFGTGQGGLPVTEVVGPMLDGMTGYLSDPDNHLAEALTDLYISAFAQADVDAVTTELADRLARLA